MLARSVRLLSRSCAEVLVACGAAEGIPGYACVQDQIHGIGPIAGIQAALAATGKAILALACDLPCMDVPTLQRLVHAHARRPSTTLMTTFRRSETGHIEALTAIYEPSSLPLFDMAIAAGVSRISRVIPQALRHDVVYTAAEAQPFLNANRPEDLERARRALADKQPTCADRDAVRLGGYMVPALV